MTGTWMNKIEIGIKIVKMMFTFPAMVAETTYGDMRIQKLMATEKFDLFMFSEASNTSLSSSARGGTLGGATTRPP